jgi:uncharacterized membrane protein
VALRIALRVLALCALAIGVFLSIERSRGHLPPCPVGGGGCETVQRSSWSAIGGVPVSTLGALGAACVLACTFWRRDEAPIAILGLTLAGALFSGYLTYLEGYRIHAWCAWCLASAALWCAMLVVALPFALRAAPIAEEG